MFYIIRVHLQIGEANAHKNKQGWPPPVSKLHSLGSIIVYKYTPNWLRVGDYSEKESSDNQSEENVFLEIIPRQNSN